MVEPESIKKAEGVLEKVTAVQKDLVNTLHQISTAVDQNKIVDLASMHSQAPSGDACQIQDLEPAMCPPGSDRLEDLKSEAESGQEQCAQKATAAKETLKILDTKAKKINAAGLALRKEKRLSSQLDELKEVTKRTAEVFGDADQVKGMDEVLEAAGVSGPLSKASKEEEYEKLSKLLAKEYFQKLNEVSLELILRNGLPMELDKIVAILDECDAVHKIGEAAGQGRKEVQEINDGLKKHLDARLQQALALSLCNPLFFPNSASLGSSAIVKVPEQVGAAKIPLRKGTWKSFPSNVPRKRFQARFPERFPEQGSEEEVPKQGSQEEVAKQGSQEQVPQAGL